MNTAAVTTDQEVIMDTTALRTADVADVLAAGMDFPMRDALRPMSHVNAVALIRDRRQFWLAAAATYASQVQAGCAEAEFDVADALAQAKGYAA